MHKNIILRLSNEVGNQMFMYAAAYSIAKKMNRLLYLDNQTAFLLKKNISSYGLNHFNINTPIVSDKLKFKYTKGYLKRKFLIKTDFMRSKKAIEKATSRGLIIFPYLVRKSKTIDMMRFAIKKNINVIQSHNQMSVFPRLIQFYVGVIRQYIKPIYVHQPFIEDVSNRDYLDMYTKEWDRVSRR